jgi:hypothetical protein
MSTVPVIFGSYVGYDDEPEGVLFEPLREANYIKR